MQGAIDEVVNVISMAERGMPTSLVMLMTTEVDSCQVLIRLHSMNSHLRIIQVDVIGDPIV